jgi:D-alanine-D-alanine ligase
MMALKVKAKRSLTEPVVRTRQPKVVILNSVFSDWTQDDTLLSDECLTRMKRGLNVVGVEAEVVQIKRDIAGGLKGYDPREYVVFNWCEGLDGEPNAYDAVPPVLEELGYAYTGADAWALATTQDKAATKKILLEAKIPTPVSKVYDRAVLNGWRRYPALVKPATEHCSFGITRDSVVDDPQQLKERIQYVLDMWKCPALVEDFIDGTEYNVSVWGNADAASGDDAQVLPVSALDYSAFPDYHDRLCSFDAKWNPESEAYRLTAVQCPALLDKTLKRRIERVALATYKALKIRDYGRVDMRVRNGVPYVLDVNANPDITMEGGFARSCRAAGYDYGQSIARIVGFAAGRMPR